MMNMFSRRYVLKMLLVSSFLLSKKTIATESLSKINIDANATTPEGDGVTDASTALMNLFKSGKENIYIPEGVYLIENTIRVKINKDINITCAEGAVFKLAPMARKNMFVFIGNTENKISWRGGEFDGNYSNQGGETRLKPDVSHGFIVSSFKSASLSEMFLHDFMGHHINHGANDYFSAKNIKIRSHISPVDRNGGRRGDGITGCSKNIYIDNVTGFCTDDLVGIFSGITWIDGMNKDEVLRNHINNIVVKNIKAESLYDEEYHKERYTWHAVSIACSKGYNIDKVLVDNVSGNCQDGGIRFPSVKYGKFSRGDLVLGTINYIKLSNIDLYVHADHKNVYSTSAILFGSYGKKSFETIGYKVNTLEIEKVTFTPNSSNRFGIYIGNVNIDKMKVSDYVVDYKNSSDYISNVYISGVLPINSISLSGIKNNGKNATKKEILDLRKLVTFAFNNNEKCTLLFNGDASNLYKSNSYEQMIGFVKGFKNNVVINN